MSHATCIVAVESQRRDLRQITAKAGMQLAPFDENGEFFKSGSRWDWWQVGGRYDGRLIGQNIVQRSELTDSVMIKFLKKKAEDEWTKYEAEDPRFKPFWEMPDGITKNGYIQREIANKISAFAFLKDGIWYENERLGWFGGRAATECQIEGREEGKCIVGDLQNPPAIVGFNESNERWQSHYFQRFIANLNSETWLVLVDYHV